MSRTSTRLSFESLEGRDCPATVVSSQLIGMTADPTVGLAEVRMDDGDVQLVRADVDPATGEYVPEVSSTPGTYAGPELLLPEVSEFYQSISFTVPPYQPETPPPSTLPGIPNLRGLFEPIPRRYGIFPIDPNNRQDFIDRYHDLLNEHQHHQEDYQVFDERISEEEAESDALEQIADLVLVLHSTLGDLGVRPNDREFLLEYRGEILERNETVEGLLRDDRIAMENLEQLLDETEIELNWMWYSYLLYNYWNIDDPLPPLEPPPDYTEPIPNTDPPPPVYA